MSRDTATPKYDIKFNERDLAGYGPELEEWSNIYRITINFEWDYDNIEEISIIYEKKNN